MPGCQQIVVDGYNVIYADDALRKIALKDMERARGAFLARIAAYVADKAVRVIVVFDGKGGLSDAESIIPGKLQAVYSDRHRTADDLIISMVGGSGNPKAYLVVSSDRAHIRPAVAALGCRTIGAKEFLDRISGKKRSRPAGRQEEKPRPDSDDRDFWLDRFGGGGRDDT